MAFHTEIHWAEGMFLRPHHLQAGQRWLETVVRNSLYAARPMAWGFLSLDIPTEPLENHTLRLDRCEIRMKDGTWVRIPENTNVEPLKFEEALTAAGPAGIDVFFGIPQMQDVRPNSISLENPESFEGSPRYEPQPITRRDENSGANPQTLYVRRMRGRLFVAGEDSTGYEIVRVGRVKRSARTGAVPELDDIGSGPLLAVQAHPGLGKILNSLSEEIEAKDGLLARHAREHQMTWTDGVADHTAHLLKLHVLNEATAHLRALLQCPVLHPYDVFLCLSRVVGHLAVFHQELVPGALPNYDHDHPAESLELLRKRIGSLLDAMIPENVLQVNFIRKKGAANDDGFQVELERSWIDENLEMYVGLHSELDVDELERQMRQQLGIKLASPTTAPKIATTAVRGLKLQKMTAPPAGLPIRRGLHYFRVDKTVDTSGPDRRDYWKECEQERGIRFTMTQASQATAVDKLKPTLYVLLKGQRK